MYKLTYNLARINPNLQVDVTVFVQNDDTMAMSNFVGNKDNFKTVRKFTFKGDRYYRFNPRPFIDITIDPDQKDMYVPQKRIRCNKMDVYKLIRSLEKMTNAFKTETDLFYYYDNKLTLDEEKKVKLTDKVVLRERVLLLEPTIIIDITSGNQHEGITIFVNDRNTACIITYLEMEFLLHILKTTDIDSIAYLLYMNADKDDSIDCDKNNISMDTADIPDEDKFVPNNKVSDNTVTYATPKNMNTIPDI